MNIYFTRYTIEKFQNSKCYVAKIIEFISFIKMKKINVTNSKI